MNDCAFYRSNDFSPCCCCRSSAHRVLDTGVCRHATCRLRHVPNAGVPSGSHAGGWTVSRVHADSLRRAAGSNPRRHGARRLTPPHRCTALPTTVHSGPDVATLTAHAHHLPPFPLHTNASSMCRLFLRERDRHQGLEQKLNKFCRRLTSLHKY